MRQHMAEFERRAEEGGQEMGELVGELRVRADLRRGFSLMDEKGEVFIRSIKRILVQLQLPPFYLASSI